MTIISRAFTICLAIVLAGLIKAGCSHSANEAMKVSGIDRIRYLELRLLAESRLQCPSRRLSYSYEGNKVHAMRGCGGAVRYLIFSIDDMWVKVESFHERAKFDLKCSIKKMRTQRVNDSTWRVMGCDRKTYYALLCAGEGKDCHWENRPEYEFE